MAVFNKFRKSVFGYDIFISYSRKDSLDYAYAVAQYFMRKGYECYIDQLSSIAPGQKLPPNIKEAVKRSSAFVVIGSEGAQSSEPIRDEINLFLNNNKNKPLIPVTIEGAINDNSIWFERIRGLALIDDSKTNLESSTPAQDVLDRIENALKFTKKSARLRNTALVTLLSVVAIVVGITLYAQAKVRKAVDEVAKAGEKVALANKLTVQAETKQKNAEAKVAQANVKLGQLNSQLKGVLQQYQSEKKKVNEVKVELKNAGQQKVAMELLAKKNKALADEYDKVAFARNLASEAFFEKEENPQLAALKVLFAVKQFQGKPKIDPLVEKAFRTIATSQTGIAVRPFKKEIKAVCISPDMNYAAVADHYGEVAVFAVKNKSDAILKLDLNEEEPAYRLFFDAASQYLMAVKGKDDSPKKTLTIFDLSETEGSKDFRRDFDCLTAAINKDLNTVAFVDTTFNVFEISLDGNTSIIPKPLFKLENAETATNLEFSDDNRKVAIGLSNSLVELWDINRPSQPLRTIHANHRSTDDSSDLAIGTLRFTHDDKYLLTGTERRFATDQDDTLKLWPIDDALALPKKYVNEYGPFDTFIFDSVISSINIDGKILTWGISSESSSGVDSIGTHNVGDDGIREGLFSNDGNRVLLSDEGGKVLLLQKENDKFLEKSRFYYSPAPVTAFDLSRDGSFIVSGDNEGVVKITQTAKGNEAVIKLNGLGRKIADVRTSSDYGRVVIEGDENTGVWDIRNPAKPILLYAFKHDTTNFPSDVSNDGKWAIVKDSIMNGGAVYDLDNRRIVYHDSDLNRYSGEFSPASKYLLRTNSSFFQLYDLEKLKTKVIQRGDEEGYRLIFNKDESWAVSKSAQDEGIDSLRFWFLNSDSDTLVKEVKKVSKGFGTIKFFSPNQLACLSKMNSSESFLYLFTLQNDGTLREDSIQMIDPADSIAVDEKGNYILTYNAKASHDDNPYFDFTACGLWPVKKGVLSSDAYLFSGTTPIQEAKFSHSGKWLVTIGGEKNIVEVWQVDADTLKLISRPVGPFSGFDTRWDFEFSPDDKNLIFYSTFGEAPYVMSLGSLPVNPVAIALKNGKLGIKSIAFSPQGDSLYVYNSNRSGWSSLIKNQRLSVNVFDLNAPESVPSELYNGSLGQIRDYQLINKYFFLVTDKEATIQLVDFLALRKKLEKSLGRNFTWNEWNSNGRDADYSLISDSLPPDYSAYVYLFNYIIHLHENGSEDKIEYWIKRMNNFLKAAKDPELYNATANLYRYYLSKNSLALEAANQALHLKPNEKRYLLSRALAYWNLSYFKEAEPDLRIYLDWYRNERTGKQDVEHMHTIQSYLDRIINSKMPE